jgi:hypothetical protein
MSDFKHKLGDRVKDRVTGYTGIVTSQIKHLNGCHQYGVSAPIDDQGKMVDGYNIDEAQLEPVDDGLNEKPVPQTPTGGAMTPIKPNKI